MATSTPSIRPYRAEDRKAAIAILVSSDPWKRLGYGAADWQRLFEPPLRDREGLIVEVDGAVVGLALLRPRFLLGEYVELLAIAPAAQGKGLGRLLLAHLEKLVFARANNLFVCVSDFNDGARRFYRRHGYQEIGPIPDLLVTGSAEILLRKTIGPVRKT